MSTYKIKFAGFGGQGILFLGKFVSELANKYNKNTIWLPSYGPEMRGGTANCSVIISDEEIPSPVVEKSDFLVALNQPSFDKFSKEIEENGVIIIDSMLVKTDKKSNSLIEINATEIAEKLGNKKVANMVIAGALLKKIDLFDLELIKEVLKESGFKESIVELNLKALNS